MELGPGQQGRPLELTSLDIFDIAQRPPLPLALQVPAASIVAAPVPEPTNPNISDTVLLYHRRLVDRRLVLETK